MLKYLLLVLTLLSSQTSAKSSWDEDKFNWYVSLSSANQDQDSQLGSSIKNHRFSSSIVKQHIGQGYGLRILGTLSPVDYSSERLATQEMEYSLNTEGVIFFSPTNELSSELKKYQRLNLISESLESTLLGNTGDSIVTGESNFIDWRSGKDKEFFSLELSYSEDTRDFEELVTVTSFRTEKSQDLGFIALFRQSEDTFWGLTANKQKKDRNINDIFSSYDINNVYLTSKFSYLGSSLLVVNLGSSDTNSQSQFSWQLEHKTNYRDYISFSLLSYQRFESSLQSSESEDLNTRVEGEFDYVVTDYLSLSVAAHSEIREKDQVKVVSRSALAIKSKINYLQDWVFSFGFDVEKMQLHQQSREYQSSQIKFQITRTII